MAICFTPELVLTLSMINGTNKLCIDARLAIELQFPEQRGLATVAGEMCSSCCQFVRCELRPSVSQSAA